LIELHIVIMDNPTLRETVGEVLEISFGSTASYLYSVFADKS